YAGQDDAHLLGARVQHDRIAVTVRLIVDRVMVSNDVQVLIVDDGSSDGTLDMARRSRRTLR
ncbi:hypothetical protein, partial [Bifidobacterium adolescentis]|uniref:hypothetical protein n=1 Tax=Bifidobacterium adolescentis TaxID=1680 RepID=UPI001E31CD55